MESSKNNMESNKNNNNNDGEEGQQEQDCSSKKNREAMNDQDLEQIVQLPRVTAQVQVTGENETADEDKKQAEVPILPPMKIQMSKETWFDKLTFAPRYQLGQLVPQVGDRRFAHIAQSFLHDYGRHTLANICISGPRHRLLQHAVEIPENVKDFQFICLSYLSTPVINLLQKFQQALLFGNVNLDLRLHPLGINNELRNTLSHILPTIDNFNSIRGSCISQLVGLYNADSEMAMTMLKMARFLDIFQDDFNFAPSEIAFLNRWLHTPRDDGKPRMLILPLDYYEVDVRWSDQIPHFIDGTIKLEFAKAKLPVCFFIRLFVCDTVEWQDSSMENVETKEKLVVKKVATTRSGPTYGHQTMALISRYPLTARKHWIEANEREALGWDFDELNGRICLGYSVRNAIGRNEDENWSHSSAIAADAVAVWEDQGGNRYNSNYGDGGRNYHEDRRGLPRTIRFGNRRGRGGRGGEYIDIFRMMRR